jgi:hypothetical protein
MAIAVPDKIAEEVAVERVLIEQIEADLPEAQAEYDRAWDEEVAAGESPPAEITDRTDAATRRLNGLWDRRASALSRIARLESPAEYEKRAATAERIRKMRARLAEKENA